MSTRQSHGSARTELPRSSDLAVPPARQRLVATRGPDGRFAPGPRHGDHRAPRSFERRLAEQLGVGLAGDAGELTRQAWATYRGLLDELPALTTGVRDLVMQRAIAATLALRYTRLGLEAGIGSESGSAALSEAAKWSQRDERLAISSLDVSTRLAAAAAKRPIDVHANVFEAFGRKEGT